MLLRLALATLTLLLLPALLPSGEARADAISWVTVGGAGNLADSDPETARCGGASDAACGAVGHVYAVSRFEVTNAQYAGFLNAVAVGSDPNGLWSPSMGAVAGFGGIARTGAAGAWSYAAKPGLESRPVVYVSFWDAVRFANWLHNGSPTGAQDAATTEDGAYTLTAAAIAANAVLRNPGARFFLPDEDEWYKAAFYDPVTGSYFAWPGASDATPVCGAAGAGAVANCARVVNGLVEVGSYGLPGPNGTEDQGGNVWEWNDSVKDSGTRRGLRGGAWSSDAETLAAVWDGYLDPDFALSSVGFRIASVPEPSSAALLALGLASTAAWRRRSAAKR